MTKTVTLTFENPNKDRFTVDFETLPTVPESVLNSWSSKFMQFLNTPTGKVETRFSAFELPRRSREYLVNKLEGIINKINTSWLNTEYGYTIEITEIPIDYPTSVHNIVHHHFETLIGQLWSHSDWWNLIMDRNDGTPDYELAKAVKGLNEISHELEEYNGIPNLAPHLHTLFIYDKDGLQTEVLPEEVKSMFKIGNIRGAVFLQYTQTGKTLFEVLNDDDDHIDIENISAHRLVNGSVSICFASNAQEPKEGEVDIWQTKAEAFAQEHNLNLDDWNLALGRPHLGQLVYEDIDELVEKIREYDQLVGMEMDGVYKEIPRYEDIEYDFN